MIRQCLPNKNESATVPKTKKFSKLNKTLEKKGIVGPTKTSPNNQPFGEIVFLVG